ncbi:MAG: hypothetical protein F6J87_24465 [Spirulina sp. SIO3F2]|nr:hypothetical protein [Spirulina sp. SIO3F2]
MNLTSLSHKRIRRFSAVTLVGVMVTLTATACGETKVAQCNKLIEVINKGEEIDQKFEAEAQALSNFDNASNFAEFKDAASAMATAFGSIADDVDTYLEEVNAVELSDEELATQQEKYAEQGVTFSGLIRSASDLFAQVSELDSDDNGDPTPDSSQQLMDLAPGFEDFSRNVETSSQEIDTVITNINTYCGVTPEEGGSDEE